MLGLVDSFSDKWLAFLWEQTVPHHCLTCSSVPMKMSFWINKRKLARKFNLSYRYIDDLISFNNKRFKEFISDIYPKQLTVSETTESTSVASYLDLLFIRDNSNNITTKLYDKRDTFGFHIVNFPFMSSNIPSAPPYGVYASQLAMPVVAQIIVTFYSATGP